MAPTTPTTASLRTAAALRRGHGSRTARRGTVVAAAAAAGFAAALGAGAWWRTAVGAAPSPPSGFAVGGGAARGAVAVLERRSVGEEGERRGDASAEGGPARGEPPMDDARKMTRSALNATAAVPSSGLPERRARLTEQGPPWASCMVEYKVDSGLPAYEEWVMRGEQENLDAFKAWRRSGGRDAPEPDHVRCSPAGAQSLSDTLCLECVSHGGLATRRPAAGGLRGTAVATVQGEIVSTFSDLQQCVAETTDGKGFCMSGQVVFPTV